MTEQQLKEFLDENKADIHAAVKRAAIDRLIAQHSWDITAQIKETVSAFVTSEIIPEVEAALAEQKGALVSGVIGGLASIADELAKGLAADAAKTISDDWRRKQVVKAIFNL